MVVRLRGRFHKATRRVLAVCGCSGGLAVLRRPRLGARIIRRCRFRHRHGHGYGSSSSIGGSSGRRRHGGDAGHWASNSTGRRGRHCRRDRRRGRTTGSRSSSGGSGVSGSTTGRRGARCGCPCPTDVGPPERTMHDGRCTTQAALCTMHDARCTMYDARCMPHDVRCATHDARCTLDGATSAHRNAGGVDRAARVGSIGRALVRCAALHALVLVHRLPPQELTQVRPGAAVGHATTRAGVDRQGAPVDLLAQAAVALKIE